MSRSISFVLGGFDCLDMSRVVLQRRSERVF